MSTPLSRTPVLETVYEYYQEDPPVDATPVRFADESNDSVASASLLAQMSPVWKCALRNTVFRQTGALDVGLTRAQFKTVKDMWLRLMATHPHPSDLRRASAAFAIRLLIAVDRLQIHRSVVDHLMEHAQSALTVADVAEIAGDPSIEGLPEAVLELILPTLLSQPEGVRITNAAIKHEVDHLKAHLDPRGLVWIDRRRSLERAKTFHLSDGQPFTLRPGNAPPYEPRQGRSFTLVEMLPLDDTHAIVQVQRLDAGRAHYLMCFDTNTGEMVGRPQRIAHVNQPMLMNGLHFVFPGPGLAEVHVRTRAFFEFAERHVPQQTIELTPLAQVHVLCRGTSDLLFVERCRQPYTLTVLRCTRPDDAYTPQYVIDMDAHCGPDSHIFGIIGGLVLSPTRVVLHFYTTNQYQRHQMNLQIFERDAPVCQPCYAGGANEIEEGDNHRSNGTHRLCHKYGLLYFLQDRNSLKAFDANTDDLTIPMWTKPVLRQAALEAYGTRILLLPTNIQSRILFFDPRTARLDPRELETRMTYAHKTIALQGGNIVLGRIEGEFYIVGRVE